MESSCPIIYRSAGSFTGLTRKKTKYVSNKKINSIMVKEKV